MKLEDQATARIVKRYRIIASVTVSAVVFLILVGGIVRSTGAGMGCPDWPTCFGKIIPPTHVSQLPANYQEIYKNHGYGSTEFNAVKTWIEYVNRLIGVLIGLLAIATTIAAIPLRKFKAYKKVFTLSWIALLLIVIQGGIGALVVRTNLQVGMVTIHMLVAIICLMVLITALLYAYQPILQERLAVSGIEADKAWWVLGGVSVVLILMQILVGTQVREMVDIVAAELGYERRGEWIEALGVVYSFHKSSYYVVVLSILLWAVNTRKFFEEVSIFKWLMVGMVVIVCAEVTMGISMHHFAIPPFIQPVHLLFAILLFSCAFTSLGIMYLFSVKASPKLDEQILNNV